MSTLEIQIQPFPKQHQAWQILQNQTTTELLYGGSAGGGKAQPLDALVSTPFGFKPMGSIKVGDLVSHPSGTNTTVIAIHPQGVKPIYRFTFSDGATCEATDEHLWLVSFSSKRSKQERKSGNKGAIRTSQWLFEYMQRIESHKRKNYPIIPLSREIQYTRPRGRGRQPATEIDPYVLGVLIGDGCLKHGTTFTSADPEIPAEIERLGYRVKHTPSSYTYTILTATRNSRGHLESSFRDTLRTLGLTTGAESKFIPDYFKTASIEERYALLQGLFDTDGTADPRGHAAYTSVSKQLALDVQYLVRSLGGKATISTKQGAYRLPTGERQLCRLAYTVYVTIRDPFKLFRLDRKRQRCYEYEFNGGVSDFGRRMVKIERVEDKPAQCITVDNPDGLYITNDFIVTHNSRLGCEWLLFNCITYPGSRWLMGRAVLKTLKQTTLLTLLDVAKSWGLKQSKQGLPPYAFNYNEQQGEITFWNGSQIHLKDLAYYPSDPEYDSLGSTEYTGAFVDEANQVRVKAKEIITVRLRYRLDDFGLTPKLLMTCNPAKNWVYSEFYKPHRDGKLDEWKAFIQALPTDNPYLPAATLESMKRIKDRATKERLLYGNWEYDDDPLALFDATALYDLYTNLFEQTKPLFYITCDAARLGRDLCVIMVWEGLKVVHITSYPVSRLTTIEAEIERLRQVYSIPRSRVIVDEDGVGGGIVDHLPGIKGFIANAKPIQDERKRRQAEVEGQGEYKLNYDRLKTQCYYLLADKVNAREIAVTVASPEEQERLTEELAAVKGKNADKDAKIQMVNKDEMKEILGRSPDYADTLMMRMVFELEPERAGVGFWVMD